MTSIEGKMSHKTDERTPLRSFGFLIGGLLTGIGIWPVVFHHGEPRLWALIPAAVFVAQALLVPMSLSPVYRLWMKFGHALGWVNTRIILAILFYAVVTPMGWMMRVFGTDPMRRRFDSRVETYRETRVARPSAHMRRQF